MRKIIFLFLTLFIFQISSIKAQQGENFIQDFTEALRLMEEGYKSKSLAIWKEISSYKVDNANVNYKTGYCQLLQNNNRKAAITYLEKAVALQTTEDGRFLKKDYDPIAPRETNAPIDALYYLGEAYLLNYELDKAKSAFARFTEISGPKHRLAENANRGMEMTENAKFQLANERKDISIRNIGNTINGEYNDFSPVISADENAIFYTSRRLRNDSSNLNLFDVRDGELYEDMYVSFKNRKGDWQAPELLNINNSSEHSASINVSINGQRLFIYNGSVGNGDLYESALVGEVWTSPTSLSPMVNKSKSWETHCALSADERTLFFVSDQSGGFGKRDIYRCVILPNGEWSKALNIGPTINTKYDEDAVFIHPDGRTLYFSSKGHNSMGGFDVFKTTIDEDGIYSEPENIGYPLNTVEDDIFFVTSPDNRRAYFSSDREGGYGNKDIYVVDLPTPEGEDKVNLTLLKGYVTAPEGEDLPEDITILITDKESGETSTYRPRMKDGAFIAILPPCKEYTIEYFRGEEKISSEDLVVECDMAYHEIQREIMLASVNVGGGEVVQVQDDKFAGSETNTGNTTTGEGSTSTGNTGSSTSGTQGTSSSTNNIAEYQRYFGYNEKDIQTKDQEFNQFMSDVQTMAQNRERVDIIVVGSASRVPTKTWTSNKILSNKRATDAKETILAKAKSLGIDLNKLNFVSTRGIIQGPKYKYDFEKNRLIYEQFQYVKLTAK